MIPVIVGIFAGFVAGVVVGALGFAWYLTAIMSDEYGD